MQPSPEEIREWAEIALRRNAILPRSININGRYISIICGSCGRTFDRKLLPGRNDPVYVCPDCESRNYVPVEW
jgi:DNA-directed RNA polymerase subunit RPC12/RpoP